MGEYLSFRTNKEILSSIYKDEQEIRDRIKKQSQVNVKAKRIVDNTNKKLYTFQVPKDFSTEWVPMDVENDGTLEYERQFKLWTFNFPAIDEAVLPYFKVDVLYKEAGMTDTQPIALIGRFQKHFLIRSTGIPHTSNVDLVINTFVQITGNTQQLFTKVNLFFTNPYLFT